MPSILNIQFTLLVIRGTTQFCKCPLWLWREFSKVWEEMMLSGLSWLKRKINNRKYVLQTWSTEFEKCLCLPGRQSVMKDAVKLHYGKCREKCFWEWPIFRNLQSGVVYLSCFQFDYSMSCEFIATLDHRGSPLSCLFCSLLCYCMYTGRSIFLHSQCSIVRYRNVVFLEVQFVCLAYCFFTCCTDSICLLQELTDVVLQPTPTIYIGFVFAAGLKTEQSGSSRRPGRRGYCNTCLTCQR